LFSRGMFSGEWHQSRALTLNTESNTSPEATKMKTAAILSLGVLLTTGAAYAQQVSAGRAELMSSVPQSSRTVTDWYKQNVYDPNDKKIGEIMDVLIEPSGQANTAIIGVGGFLGAGEKDVAVKFDAIKSTMKDNKPYLTLDTNKDALKNAPGFKYDSSKTTWVPDNSGK
jgi:sporulation protein YlmC with PRC-barrel domain